jgi:hypothetical protein
MTTARVLTSVGTGQSYGRATTISILPDNVFLEIFNFHRRNYEVRDHWHSGWRLLVHVCRRWRQIVFASPHRLDLLIVCKRGTPVRKYLGIWPTCPIILQYGNQEVHSSDEDNIIAALHHHDRVCDIELHITRSQLEKMVTVMQEPFPVLTNLRIRSDGKSQALPCGFLRGPAPSLQAIYLHGIPFPTLPTLLLSANDLVTLNLRYIPPTGYISPEAMVVGLAALPRLQYFIMEFQSVTSRPDRIPPPPATRTVLPTLIEFSNFSYEGASEYLEALVAQVDAPQLKRIEIQYFNQLADFRAAQLSQFIDRSAGPETLPETTPIRYAEVDFHGAFVSFAMFQASNSPSYQRKVRIGCRGIDWQVSHMAQVLSQISVTLSSVVHLWLKENLLSAAGTDDIEWLLLLHSFSAVRTLRVDNMLAGHVAPALEDTTGGMAAEVLPSLELIWICGQRVKKFDAARQLSGRPIIVCTQKEFHERLESYAGE